MRGKIIQYNGADGSGTVVVAERQHRFALEAWRGDNAPVVGKVVEVMLEDDQVTTVLAVGDDVLLKEKAAELGGKLGALMHKVPTPRFAPGDAKSGTVPGSSGAAPGATAMAGSIIERYGKAILLAYLLFLLGTLAFNAISVSLLGQGMGKSLFDISSAMSQLGGSGGGSIKALLLLAYASIATPMVWHDRRAWFALALPLLALLWAIFSATHALNSLGGGIADGMSDFFSISFGFYLSLLAALALAVLGARRALREAWSSAPPVITTFLRSESETIMHPHGKMLAALLASFLLTACGGGVSGTYEGELGSLAFNSGKVDATLMGGTIEMDYSTEGDRVVLHSPQGDLVLKRNQDGSLDTPWGMMKKKKS